MVECIEELTAKLEVVPFANSGVLQDRQVPAIVGSGANAGEPKRERPKIRCELASRLCDKARIGIEPPVYIPLAARERNIFDIAGEENVSKSDRLTGVYQPHGAQLPSADDSVREGAGIRTQRPAAAEGEFIDSRHREAVRAI